MFRFMNPSDITEKFDISESLVSKIKHGKRFTDDIALAIAVSQLSGKSPIKHIRRRVQPLALAAHPELGKKVKSA